jgi:hypothetical protein
MIEKKYYLLRISNRETPRLIFKSSSISDLNKVSRYLKDAIEDHEIFFITENDSKDVIEEWISEELICEIFNN